MCVCRDKQVVGLFKCQSHIWRHGIFGDGRHGTGHLSINQKQTLVYILCGFMSCPQYLAANTSIHAWVVWSQGSLHTHFHKSAPPPHPRCWTSLLMSNYQKLVGKPQLNPSQFVCAVLDRDIVMPLSADAMSQYRPCTPHGFSVWRGRGELCSSSLGHQT